VSRIRPIKKIYTSSLFCCERSPTIKPKQNKTKLYMSNCKQQHQISIESTGIRVRLQQQQQQQQQQHKRNRHSIIDKPAKDLLTTTTATAARAAVSLSFEKNK
jgi:hypothetical protein